MSSYGETEEKGPNNQVHCSIRHGNEFQDQDDLDQLGQYKTGTPYSHPKHLES